MKFQRGKHHEYLGMGLDYSHTDNCCVTMYDNLGGILGTAEQAMKDQGNGLILVTNWHSKTKSAHDNPIVVNEDCDKLPVEAVVSVHMTVAKPLYVRKQARRDTSWGGVFLTTRVRIANTDYWEMVSHLMEYLRGSQYRPFVPCGKNNSRLVWNIDVLFVVHLNMRNHMGGGLTMGRGSPIAALWRPNWNIKSLTES